MNNHKKQNAIKQLNGILKELENPQNHLNDSLPLQLAELLKLFLGSESILYKQVIDLLHSRTKGGFLPLSVSPRTTPNPHSQKNK